MWSSSSRSFASASASVAPMTGTMPGSTLMWSGSRPAAAGTGLEIGVEGAGVLDGLLGGEHRLRVPGRELLAVLAGARLHEQRVTLGRAGHVERALDAEVRPLVPGRVDLRVVAPDAGGLVADDRVVLPAVPELEGHVEELTGPGVPVRVRGLVLETEVAGGLLPAVVTMFQPARPPLMMSSEANFRARL